MIGKLPTCIKRRADLKRAVTYLCASDPHLARAVATAGPVGFKMRRPGFASLLKIIVEQQLSTASALAIWGRLVESVNDPTPDYILSLSDSDMRAVGMSAPKMRYCRVLAEDVVSGRLNLARLSRMSDQKAMDALLSVVGIGRWTAEIYLLFCLGRPDVWPAGDIAVRSAIQNICELDERPRESDTDRLAERWRPLRGVAALILWNYYRHVKKRPMWE